MQQIRTLPFRSHYEADDPLNCVLWRSETNVCEFNAAHMPAPADTSGVCDPSGLYYGTADAREPMFCARHLYLQVIAGTGTQLIDEPAAVPLRLARVQRSDAA